MRRALEEPLRWIAHNAGLEGSVVVSDVEAAQGHGRAQRRDRRDRGPRRRRAIIDPAKVTRSALQNAASIAALLLTTDVLVADKPEAKTGAATPEANPMGMM